MGVILCRGGEDDLLGAGLEVGLHLFLGEEGTRGLAHVCGAGGNEGDFFRVARVRGGDALSIEDEVHAVHLHSTGKLSVNSVVLKLFDVFPGGKGGGHASQREGARDVGARE